MLHPKKKKKKKKNTTKDDVERSAKESVCVFCG